jgi:hypothetical protein
MATAKDWGEAKAAALKILGDKAKIPEPKGNIDKLFADVEKARKEFGPAVSVLEDKIVALQNANSAWKNGVKQFDDQLSKSDLGLDGKNPDDKKKIRQALDILTGYVESQMELADAESKNLDELDKHSVAISKFRSKT